MHTVRIFLEVLDDILVNSWFDAANVAQHYKVQYFYHKKNNNNKWAPHANFFLQTCKNCNFSSVAGSKYLSRDLFKNGKDQINDQRVQWSRSDYRSQFLKRSRSDYRSRFGDLDHDNTAVNYKKFQLFYNFILSAITLVHAWKILSTIGFVICRLWVRILV